MIVILSAAKDLLLRKHAIAVEAHDFSRANSAHLRTVIPSERDPSFARERESRDLAFRAAPFPLRLLETDSHEPTPVNVGSPQRLKPGINAVLDGAAEAAPFQTDL